MGESQYLSSLNTQQREELERKLLARQSNRCFICDQPIDLVLQMGQLDIDHIDPLVEQGLDAENNFALTHASCNRSKGAANLEVARRLAQFERLQQGAQTAGRRGANLGDVLLRYGGARYKLRLRADKEHVEFSLGEVGDNAIRQFPVFHDRLSGMASFFATFPLEYIHHDDSGEEVPIDAQPP